MNRRRFLKYFGIGSVVLPVVGVLAKNEMTANEFVDEFRKIPEQEDVWVPIDNPGFETKYGDEALEDWTGKDPIFERYASRLFSEMAEGKKIKSLI